MATQAVIQSRTGKTQEATGIPNPTVVSLSVAADGSTWAVDNQGRILQNTSGSIPWTAGGWQASYVAASMASPAPFAVIDGKVSSYAGDTWTALPAPGAAMETVAIGSDGSAPVGAQIVLWARDTSRGLWTFRYADEAWTELKVAADQVAATFDGAVYRLDAGVLYQLTAGTGTWAVMNTPEAFWSVGAGAAGFVCGCGISGTIYQFDGSQGWVKMAQPDCGVAGISCGADASVWLVANGELYQYDAAAEGWNALACPVSVAQAALGSMTTAWVLDEAGNGYQYTEFVDGWIPIEGFGFPEFQQVSAVNAGTLWAVDLQGSVYELQQQNAGWELGASQPAMAKISAGADGSVWGVNSNGAAFRLSQGSWVRQSVSPGLAVISATGSDAALGLTWSGELFEWSPVTATWKPMGGPNGSALRDVCLTENGGFFAVTGQGEPYLYASTLEQWIPIGGGSLTHIAGTGLSDCWGILSSGQAVALAGGREGGEGSIAGPEKPGWSADSIFDETRSTHLWIINRAAQLAQQQGSFGQKICSLVSPFTGRTGNVFHNSLCQGLYDADYVEPYCGPTMFGRFTYAHHFYCPTTGKSWVPNEETAVDWGKRCFALAVEYYNAGDLANAGYQLGLSLHFLSDLSQPMHAANFVNFVEGGPNSNVHSSSPDRFYHTDFENYVMEIQDGVAVTTTYVPSPLGLQPEAYLKTAASQSLAKYFDNIAPWWVYLFYTQAPAVWASVTSLIRQNASGMLSDAITMVSQYLVAWISQANVESAWQWGSQGRPSAGVNAVEGAGVIAWQDPGPSAQRPCAFVIGSDSSLYASCCDAARQNWSWLNLGTPQTAGIVSAVGTLPALSLGVAEVYVIGTDGWLYAATYIVGQWFWRPRGRPSAEAYAAKGVGPAFLTGLAQHNGLNRCCFVICSDGHLYASIEGTSGPFAWEDLGVPAAGVALASAVGATTTTLGVLQGARGLVVGSDGQVYCAVLYADQFSWTTVGFPAVGVKAVAGIGVTSVQNSILPPQKTYAFVTGDDGNLYAASGVWSGWQWQRVGAPPGGIGVMGSAGATVIQSGPGAVETPMVFVTGEDGYLYSACLEADGSGWTWAAQGLPFNGTAIAAGVGAVTPVAQADGPVQLPWVFVVGQDGGLYSNFKDVV